MKITVISASTRPDSQSLNVSNYILKQYQQQAVEADILDLNTQRLPLYDDTEKGPWQEIWQSMSQQLAMSDGFIFVSPEWNGTTGPGIINLMLYAEQEFAHKPVMLVGVSNGRGGHYPLSDMRMMGYKNRHYVIIPESGLIQDVDDVLINGELTNEWAKDRLLYGMSVLVEYAKAFHAIRDSGVIDMVKFKNGI